MEYQPTLQDIAAILFTCGMYFLMGVALGPHVANFIDRRRGKSAANKS
jgi:hypothetical protein